MSITVYDCFMFFNELDVLEIRLNELNDVVDKFVLVECTKTHSLQDKPLYFEENKARYKKFLDKIIHVVVDDMPEEIEYQHHIDNYHRACIMRGLGDIKGDDLILISDLDEIPQASSISPHMTTPAVVAHSNYSYSLNIKVVAPHDMSEWLGTVALRTQNLEQHPIQKYRDSRKDIAQNYNKLLGGWHYTYMGSAKDLMHKLKSFSHTEILEQRPNITEEEIQRCLDGDVDFLSWFRYPPFGVKYKKFTLEEANPPQYVLDNREKFNHLIKT